MQNKIELSLKLQKECYNSPPNIESIKKLIELDADPNYRDDENKNTCLYILCDRLESNKIVSEEYFYQSIEAIKFLLDNKADPNIQGEDGFTCLSRVCHEIKINEMTKVIKLLLDYKANPNVLESSGSNTLHSLCYLLGREPVEPCINFIKLLIQYKSDIKFDMKDQSNHYHSNQYHLCMSKAIKHDIYELGLLVILNQFQEMNNVKISFVIKNFYNKYPQHKNGNSLIEKLLKCMFEHENPKEIYEFIQKRFDKENSHFPKRHMTLPKQQKSSVLSFMECLHIIKTVNPSLKFPKPIIFEILNKNIDKSASKIIDDTLSEFSTAKLNYKN